MDGVLANFDQHFNKTIDHDGLNRNKFDDYEHEIVSYNDWWLKMPVMSDAQTLIKYTKPFNPYILSAAPIWHPDAKRQKTEYAKKHFGIPLSHINIVKRVDKQDYAGPNNILVDDYSKNIKEWEAAGGIGVLHKNANDSIKQLAKILNT